MTLENKVHWENSWQYNQSSYFKLFCIPFQHCSPCLINYDAIIKLETSVADEEFVLAQSSIGHYVELEYTHFKTNGNKSVEDLRHRYFSNITCTQLSKLTQVYRMDLEMFDYSVNEFKRFCSS